MKSLIIKAFTILLVLSLSTLHAQDSNVNFLIKSERIIMNGESFNSNMELCKIGDKFIWTQVVDGIQDVISFEILNSTGLWNKITSTGAISYTMEFDDNSWEFKLEASNNNFSALLTQHLSGGVEETYNFSVNSIVYQ